MDDKRLADELRSRGLLYRRNGTDRLVSMTDKEVLELTEGTPLRGRAELALACRDFCEEIRKLYERPAMKVLNFILRIINWFKGGKRENGN